VPPVAVVSGQAPPAHELDAVTPTSTGPAFVLDVRAPDEIRVYLSRHLEIQRYRELTDLDNNELARLIAAAERNARDLLGTLGYFSPVIDLALEDATATTPRTVVVTVKPGEATRVTKVDIDFTGAIRGAPTAVEQRQRIRALWALRRGMNFTQADWDSAKNQALRQLTAQRYPTGSITDSRAEIDSDNDSARLSLTLDSGPMYRLGAVKVEGTERYTVPLVDRLARITPGSEYDQSRLLEAQQRLLDSGFFDSALVTLDTTGDPAAAPVNVQVREAKLQKIVLGIGASTDSGPRLSAEHIHNQVPGIGWRAVSKVSLDRITQALGTELLAQPDEGGWRWLASGLLQKQSTNGINVYSQRYRGGRTQAGDRIDRNIYLQYDRARTSAAGIADETAESISANYAFTQRNFDTLPFPTDGYGLAVELGGGITLGSNRQPYFRTHTRLLGYWPLDDSDRISRSVLRAGRVAWRLDGGAVLARDSAQMPDTQLFLTGGDTTVRGYGLRDIGVTLPTGQTAAGRYLAVGSLEWQRPITVRDRLTDWEGTVFVDAGAVADTVSALRARVGVGAGVRWRSPVGPLQIDLAYGLTPKRLRLHLSVGFTF
jgi:translocation and assembly module TamA